MGSGLSWSLRVASVTATSWWVGLAFDSGALSSVRVTLNTTASSSVWVPMVWGAPASSPESNFCSIIIIIIISSSCESSRPLTTLCTPSESRSSLPPSILESPAAESPLITKPLALVLNVSSTFSISVPSLLSLPVACSVGLKVMSRVSLWRSSLPVACWMCFFSCSPLSAAMSCLRSSCLWKLTCSGSSPSRPLSASLVLE